MFLCFINKAHVWSPEKHTSLGFPIPSFFPMVLRRCCYPVVMSSARSRGRGKHFPRTTPGPLSRSDRCPASLFFFSYCQLISLCPWPNLQVATAASEGPSPRAVRPAVQLSAVTPTLVPATNPAWMVGTVKTELFALLQAWKKEERCCFGCLCVTEQG